ncbi:hypothetical protein PAMC26577_02665 [Caballeronia sordidicola]|uniref:Uncharacterized protein n=1 Tax=Caballeronia sordidicola TaxID=196367 RepID=A0A242N5R7_CABSO|nr:hypothetical protein PAMC26577_02665 [Caballeronia sordidicola]
MRTFHALSPEKILGQFSVDATVPLERIAVDKLMSNRTGRLSRVCPAQRATPYLQADVCTYQPT